MNISPIVPGTGLEPGQNIRPAVERAGSVQHVSAADGAGGQAAAGQGTQAANAAAAAAGARQQGNNQSDKQENANRLGGQPSMQEVQEAINDVEKAIEPVARNLQFSIDDDTGQTLIKIVDSATDEVIRQIPSEEMVAIAKALDKLKGLLIKQEV